MLCRLKILCLTADEIHARFVREVEAENESCSNWVSTQASERSSPQFILITRIRALWSSRG